MIQNRLLGLYYTTLNGYCEEFGFPSPPPPMEEVVAIWNGAIGPTRSQIETISFITRGKAPQQPTGSHNSLSPRPGPSALINGPRRSVTGLISGPQARTLRVPSMPVDRSRTPSPSGSYRRPDLSNATDFTTATILGGTDIARTTNSTPGQQQQQRPGYFRSPSPAASQASSISGSFSGSNPAFAALGKKKPPPPPPKRKPDEWVVALYAFAGQGEGDLSFQEGDRIRVVKRTGTDQDWYVSSPFYDNQPVFYVWSANHM